METFSGSLTLCEGNSPVTGEFPLTNAWDAWTNGLVNNRDASDLRRHRAHYGVAVMLSSKGTNTKLHKIQACTFCVESTLPNNVQITIKKHDDKSSGKIISGLYKYDVITHIAPSDITAKVTRVQAWTFDI